MVKSEKEKGTQSGRPPYGEPGGRRVRCNPNCCHTLAPTRHACATKWFLTHFYF
jgi:hypothetical protein